MCVPLKWCGSPTYMLNVATVCCAPPERSWMRIGCRIALTPTRSIASLRVSALAWTSGMLYRSRDFIKPILHPTDLLGYYAADRFHYPCRIQAYRCEQRGRVAVVDEAVGQSEQQHAGLEAHVRQRLAHRAPGAAHHRMLLDRHEQLVRLGQPPHELAVERLDEAHAGDRGLERGRSLERRPQHGTEREQRDASSLAAQLAAAHRQRLHRLHRRDARPAAARIAHRRRSVERERGIEHLPALVLVGRRHQR